MVKRDKDTIETCQGTGIHIVKHDKHVSSCLLEFGLGYNALVHTNDEVNSTGIEDEARQAASAKHSG